MKNLILNRIIILAVLCVGMSSCESALFLPPEDEFSPETSLQTKAGIEAVLFSAYQFDAINQGALKNEILINEVTTDIGYVRIGAVEREMKPFMNFNWDASSGLLKQIWDPRYKAIRDANTVLENIDNDKFDEDFRKTIKAEARYLRAAQYAFLFRYFGVVPLRTTTNLSEQPQALALPSAEEFRTFVETELRAAAKDLLSPAEQKQLGRATKGHAYAVLTKFLMSTKQWEKVVEVTQLLMDLNYYELFPNYRGIFFVKNEGNHEVIVSYPRTNEGGFAMLYQNGAFPPGFESTKEIPEFKWVPAMANWATQFSVRDGFTDSFDPDDDRAEAIIEQYTNRQGKVVDLRKTPDNSRSLKFWDNDQTGNFCGADFPYIRYADILLCRAEALNEINGPTQEAVDLVNRVRTRSIDDPYTLAEVGNKADFRAVILKERGWEFYSEGKRREDLIRQGKYVEYAQNRGVNAQPYQVFFPYPQTEIDANPELVQREGYE